MREGLLRRLPGPGVEPEAGGGGGQGVVHEGVFGIHLRRLFEKGGVRSVHIHSNLITVELDGKGDAAGFEDVIRELYIHYRPGVTPSFPAPA